MATQKNPTPQAFLNYGNVYQTLELGPQARKIWQHGLERFADNAFLKNNLGLSYVQDQYVQDQQPDSALYILPHHTPTAHTNRAYVHALYPYAAAQAPPLVGDAAPHPFARANAWVWALRKDTLVAVWDVDSLPALSDYASYAYAYDFFLMSIQRKDSAVIAHMETYLESNALHPYAQGLRYLWAYAHAQERRLGAAIRLVDGWQTQFPAQRGYGLYFMGCCAFEARAYEQAAAFFLRAYARGYPEALEAYLHTCERLVGRGLFDRQRVAFENMNHPRMQQWLQYVAQWQAYPPDSVLAQEESYRVRAVLLGMGRYAPSLVDTLIGSLATPLQHRLWIARGHFFLAQEDYPQAYEALLRAEALRTDGQTASLRAAYLFDVLSLEALQSTTQIVSDTQYAQWFVHTRAQNAQALFQLGRQHPLKEGLVLKTAAWLHEHGYAYEAYELLRETIADNTYAPRLYAAYSLQCLRMGLDNYAQTALEDVRDMLSEDAFARFRQDYTRVQAEQEALLDW